MRVVTLLVLLLSPVLATCFGDLWGNVWVDTTQKVFHPGEKIPVKAYFSGYNGHEPAYNYTVCVKLIKGIPSGIVRGGTCKAGHFNVYSPASFSLTAPSEPGKYWVVAYATDGTKEGTCYDPAWITVEGGEEEENEGGCGASVDLSCPSYIETGRVYTVSATISAPPGSRVRVYVDGRKIQDFLATISSWSTTVLFDTPGSHRITMEVVNGGVLASDSCTMYAYSSQPSPPSPGPSQVRGDIELTYCPSPVTAGEPFKIKGRARFSISRPRPRDPTIVIKVDGEEVHRFNYTGTDSSWKTTIVIDDPGTHTITAEFWYGDEFLDSDSCTVVVREPEPQGSITVECSGGRTRGAPVRGTASWSNCDHPEIKLYVDGNLVKSFPAYSPWEEVVRIGVPGDYVVTGKLMCGDRELDSDSCTISILAAVSLEMPQYAEGKNGEDVNVCGQVINYSDVDLNLLVMTGGDFEVDSPEYIVVPADSSAPLCVLVHIPVDRETDGVIYVGVGGDEWRRVEIRVRYRAPGLLVAPNIITTRVEEDEDTKIAEFRVVNTWHLPQTVYISSNLPYSRLSIPVVTLAPGQEIVVEVWVDAPEGRYSGYVTFRTDYGTSTHALSYRSEREGGMEEEGEEDVRVYVWDQEVKKGEEIYVRVRNFGEETVVKNVRLTGIDLEDDDRTAILRGGESRKIGFVVTDEPGEYTVTVLPWGKSFRVTVMGEEEGEEEMEVEGEEEEEEEEEWGQVEVTVQGRAGGEVRAEFRGAAGEIPLMEWEEGPTGEAVGGYGTLLALVLGTFIVGMAYALARV